MDAERWQPPLVIRESRLLPGSVAPSERETNHVVVNGLGIVAGHW